MMQTIQNKINKLVNNKSIFGIALKIEKGSGEVIFEGASGNLTVGTSYFIASTTKLYTTAMLYKLIDENKLSLSAKLIDFFDASIIKGLNIYKDKDYSEVITIKDLLAHTSGIPDYFMGEVPKAKSLEYELMSGIDRSWSFEEALALAKLQNSKFYPSQKNKALYSDTNFQLLGRIIELIRGKAIEDIFQDEIFKPLNLTKTYLYTDIADATPINLYYKHNVLKIPKAMASFKADGGIVSNIDETMIFLKAFFEGKLFDIKNVKTMTSEYNRIFFPLQYGVGVMKFSLPRIFTLFKKYPDLIGHSGLSGAFAYYCPTKDIYFTGTVNQIAYPGQSYRLLVWLLSNL